MGKGSAVETVHYAGALYRQLAAAWVRVRLLAGPTKRTMRAVTTLQVQLQWSWGRVTSWRSWWRAWTTWFIGFTVFDRQLVLVACNQRFQEMLNFPMNCVGWVTLDEALRYNARKGEYGPW